MPSHIDKDAMASMAGSMQSWVKASLRFMKLIDADDAPTDRMKKLVAAKGDERKALMKDLFRSTYAFLQGKIDLTNTTTSKLRDAIVDLGAQGETVEKIISFLVAMGRDAGVTLSHYLTKRTIPVRRRQKAQTRDNGAVNPPATHDAGIAMKTVQLPQSKGAMTLSGTFNLFDLTGDERELVFAIIDKMKEFESAHPADEEDDE